MAIELLLGVGVFQALSLFILISLSYSVTFANGCLPFAQNGTDPRSNHNVQKYKTDFQQCSYEGRLVYTVRSFNLNGSSVSLAVDGMNMSSEIIEGSCLKSCSDLNDRAFMRTVYGRLLSQSGAAPFPLQNDGLTHGRGHKVALTVDMCPSSRGFSGTVYTALANKAKKIGKSIPVGVAMTRVWKNRWPQHFDKIKKYHARGILSVEWINHSANHKYRRGRSLKNNFLLLPGTNMTDEVLGNEISLIQSGVTPSSYFRFPGLVSNRNTIDFVTNQGLVTLGANAWLAKNQKPKQGSIILVHGNKNEPIGEKELFKYMNSMASKGHSFGHLDEAL